MAVLAAGLLLAVGSLGAPRGSFLLAPLMIVVGGAAVLLSVRLKQQVSADD